MLHTNAHTHAHEFVCVLSYNIQYRLRNKVCGQFNTDAAIFQLHIFTAFLCQSTSPKKQRTGRQSTPVNKNNAIAHQRTRHTHRYAAGTHRQVSVSLSTSLSFRALSLSLYFTSTAPTRNRHTEHETRDLHEYTARAIKNRVQNIAREEYLKGIQPTYNIIKFIFKKEYDHNNY